MGVVSRPSFRTFVVRAILSLAFFTMVGSQPRPAHAQQNPAATPLSNDPSPI